ncbi:MAG: CDP-alcohol phosphatidyltransferase family protein [Candidatus Eisenbacteria bacterium]
MTLVAPEKKEWFRSLFDPVTRFFVQTGVHPNVLTLVGFLLACLSGWRLWDGHFRSGALLFLLGGLFDTFDGSVARATGRGSRFGAFLDSSTDRYAEIVPLLGLSHALRDSSLFLLPFLVITGSLMVSYNRARIEGLGGECSVGLLERPERVVILFLGLVLGSFFLPLSLVLLAAGSHYTAFQRMRHARKVL